MVFIIRLCEQSQLDDELVGHRKHYGGVSPRIRSYGDDIGNRPAGLGTILLSALHSEEY